MLMWYAGKLVVPMVLLQHQMMLPLVKGLVQFGWIMFSVLVMNFT